MKRKEFIQKLFIGSGFTIAIPTLLIQSCETDYPDNGPTSNPNPPATDLMLDLDDPQYLALQSDGGFVRLASNNIIVINKGNGEYVALSSICTHQGCTVGYNQNSNTLPCPCHGSVFNINGSVLQGPAASPLRLYNTSLDANILVIKV